MMTTSDKLDNFHKKYKHLIVFKELDFIDMNKPYHEQKDELQEDMFQMACKNKDIAIDIGWYWESEDYLFNNLIKGSFVLKVIKDMDWLHPCEEYSTHNFDKLVDILLEFVSIYCNDKKM
jgi:hypothetical protein